VYIYQILYAIIIEENDNSGISI